MGKRTLDGGVVEESPSSHESNFNIVGSNGREWCWKRHGELLSNCVVSKIVKHEGGSFMVWGFHELGGHWGATAIERN